MSDKIPLGGGAAATAAAATVPTPRRRRRRCTAYAMVDLTLLGDGV